MKIKVPIFSKQVVLMAKLLSPLDIAKLSKVVQEPVQSGLTRLCLRQVKVTQLSAKASWRSPDISSFAFIRGDFDPVTEPAVSLMDSLSVATDAPLEIGGYVSLPWQCIDGEGNCLYRLVLEPNSVDLYSAQINEGIVFASNLTNLLSDHQTIGGKSDLVTEEPQQPIDLPTSRPTFPEELLYITDLPTSPTLAELLPENSVFSLSMLCLIRASTGNSELLVYGDRGSGKTHSALTIAAAARLSCGSNTVYMDCRKVRDSPTVRMNAILGELSKAFVDAAANSPCILILDDLDSLTMDFTDNGSTDDSMQLQQVNPVEIDQSKLITDVLRSILRAKSNNVQVVVTCQTPDSLPVSLLSDGRFCKKLAIPAYDASDGERLYQSFLRRHTKSVDVSVETITNFAKKISGFRPRDLEQLAFRANKKFLAQASSKYFLALATAEEMDLFVPLSRLGASTEPNAAIVRWSSIGGLFKAKAELTSTILRPFIYKQIYARAQIRLPRGILLYGFPGTGKSMCVPALAAECGFPLIMCRGPEILDKYIGASEAKVRDLFSRAAAVAPSILFLDELDALAPKRGSDHTGVTDRVVNQLLTFLDGVEENSQNGPVYVIAATSRPDKVDPALLRPGRLEKHVYFGFAEVNDEATDLLTKLAFHYNLDPETRESVVSGEFIRNGQQQSTSIRQLSAADLKAVLNTGQLAAVHEALAQGRTKEVVPIRYDHLFAAMISARPSLSNADYLRLSEIYAAYRDDLPDRAGADGSIAAHYGKPLRIALK